MTASAATETDVIIIGGGIVGLSIASHLLEHSQGGLRVTLLEREPALGQGSTSKANGGVRAQFTTAVNVDDITQTLAPIDGIPAVADRPGQPRRRPEAVPGDKTHDSKAVPRGPHDRTTAGSCR